MTISLPSCRRQVLISFSLYLTRSFYLSPCLYAALSNSILPLHIRKKANCGRASCLVQSKLVNVSVTLCISWREVDRSLSIYCSRSAPSPASKPSIWLNAARAALFVRPFPPPTRMHSFEFKGTLKSVSFYVHVIARAEAFCEN